MLSWHTATALRLTFVVMTALTVYGAAASAQDVAVSKSIDDPIFLPNGADTHTFTITVENFGNTPVNVTVDDPVPAGLRIPAGLAAIPGQGAYDAQSGAWDIGSLAGNVSASLQIPTVADPGAPGCISNIATATLSDPGAVDPNPANNEAVVIVAAPDCADLVIETTIESEVVNSDVYFVTLDVRVRNLGPTDASSIVLRGEIYAPRYRDVDRTAASWSCESNRVDDIVCRRASLRPEQNIKLTHMFVQPRNGAFSWNFALTQAAAEPQLSNNEVADTFDFLRREAKDASSGGCFIATAAYGTPFVEEIVTLREFRDRVLASTQPGRALINFYYRHAPPVAEAIREREWAKTLVRGLLMPIVQAIRHPGTTLAVLVAGLLLIRLGLRLYRPRSII